MTIPLSCFQSKQCRTTNWTGVLHPEGSDGGSDGLCCSGESRTFPFGGTNGSSMSGSFSCSISLWRTMRDMNTKLTHSIIRASPTHYTYQSIALSMPWLPVCATAFSLSQQHRKKSLVQEKQRKCPKVSKTHPLRFVSVEAHLQEAF